MSEASKAKHKARFAAMAPYIITGLVVALVVQKKANEDILKTLQYVINVSVPKEAVEYSSRLSQSL